MGMMVNIPLHGLVRTTIRVPRHVMKGEIIPRSWLDLPRTRESAIAKGLPWYFSGACPHGHVSVRTVTMQGCPACRREDVRRRYQKRRDTKT